MGLAFLHVSPWTRAAEAHLQSMGQDILVLKERGHQEVLLTHGAPYLAVPWPGEVQMG